jgi:sorbitol/mannitol transport system substrate-binding protein
VTTNSKLCRSACVALAGVLVLGWAGSARAETKLTVAMAANPQMKVAEKLIDAFYAENPNIRVEFQTLPENQLRPAVLKDVATNSGQFDVVMIGSYEVPLWAKKGWIVDMTSTFIPKSPAWNVDDLTPAIRNLVSYEGHVFGVPFYGSSSFMFYRKDLFKKAGLVMPEKPTWDQVASFAAKLDNKAAGMSGICLRGIPGWGQNLAPLTTVINTFGGRWFDEKWNPQLSSPKTKAAITFYVDLLKKYGQPDAAKDGWQECLQLFSQGKAAMWYDDTVFAGPAIDQASPELKSQIGFAMAPTKENKPSGWLWAWALSIPKTSRNAEAAWKFVSWVTSEKYIKLAGEKAGWQQTPPGSRVSTYKIPEYQAATKDYANLTLASIRAADPLHATIDPVPYTGVQYVCIPEFEQIGDFTSQQIAGAISGRITSDEAIKVSEQKIREIMKDAGYL